MAISTTAKHPATVLDCAGKTLPHRIPSRSQTDRGVQLMHKIPQRRRKMKITKLLLICMCCVMTAPAVWGQMRNGPAKPGILGYLDPQTGAFRPVPSGVEEGPDAAALTTFGGTITITLTITLKTTALTNITCSEEVSVIDAAATSPLFFGDSATSTATRTRPPPTSQPPS